MDAIGADDLVRIVEAGVLAPSAENCHLFKVRQDGEGLLLLGDSRFRTAPYHLRLLALISFGAVAENMVQRAATLGHVLHVDWFPEIAAEGKVARLRRVGGCERGEGAVGAAIATRTTNRRLRYGGPALAPREIEELQNLAPADAGVTIRFIGGHNERRCLLRLMRLAEAARFDDRSMHHELFSAIRFDLGWHASAEEGLPPGVLQIEPGARWAFSQLRHWPVMNVLRALGVHHMLGFRAAYLPAKLAPHLGIVTSRDPGDRGATTGGQALERLWLEAERRGLAFQPFAGAALLARTEYEAVPRPIGEALRSGWSGFTDQTPMMVFRMGRTRRPGVRTDRPAAQRFFAP